MRDRGTVSLPAGASALTWDRKVDIGRKAPSGVYFVSVRSASASIRTRVILLK